jgi:hypothetical protein
VSGNGFALRGIDLPPIIAARPLDRTLAKKSFGKDATILNTRRNLHRRRGCLRAPTRSRVCGLVARWSVLIFLLLWPRLAAAEVELPMADIQSPIRITADEARRWREGAFDVWLLSGGCEIRQGEVVATSREAVLWVNLGDPVLKTPSKIIVYLERDVVIDFSHGRQAHSITRRRAHTITEKTWLGRFHTVAGIDFDVPVEGRSSQSEPPVVRRGVEARQTEFQGTVRQVQLTQPQPLPPTSQPPTIPPFGTPSNTTLPFLAPPQINQPSPPSPLARSVSISGRSSMLPQLQTYPSSDPNETVVVISPGVRVRIGGIQNVPGLTSSVVTLEADRVVAWTTAIGSLSFGDSETQSPPPDEGRWEFYLEGNIVYREGDRVIYADQMYYHANQNIGVIRNAEALTPVKDYEGLLRIKADVLQQLNAQSFIAYGAALTSSRMGVPRYWMQAETITLQDNQQPQVDPFTGGAAIDYRTGEPAVRHEMFATSRNNFLYVGGVPLLYWPVMATDLTKPTYFVDRIRVKNNSVYGMQALIDWDVYQLLGLRNRAEGTKWTFSSDWLDDRGIGLGTNFVYERSGLFHWPGPVRGMVDAWGIKDHGLDNLGQDRRALLLEEEYRGRLLMQHRQHLANGFQFTGQIGLISDRNFLEQYYESEWDQFKDQTTELELKRYVFNSTWGIRSSARINPFFTQTEWLPRFDHYLLGQSLLGDRLTWHGHSHVGYAKLRIADPPSAINPGEVAKYDPLAWEVEREGIHVATRQELDWPIRIGPVKLVPYVMGELFKVGEDITGVSRTRALGQAGVRTSLPMWRVEPGIQSQLLNLNGLAHKITFEAEFLYADADEDLGNYPLYEQLDDDSIEAFRRRFFFDTFLGLPGGNVPLRFDERIFALRSGLQSSVTASSTEIADDLTLFKAAVRQRWQTKRGLPGHERIVDVIALNVEGTYFPEPTRDNFGESVGLLNYDFRWHIGDRLTLLSDGYADTFADGLRTFSLGGRITRPERGSLYVGMRSIEGPISSSILTSALSYRMSEKWVLTGAASIDFGKVGNIGQSFAVTRIGESTLLRLGAYVDASRDDFGINFAIEPRFLASSKLGRVGGVTIPPAGAFGLE